MTMTKNRRRYSAAYNKKCSEIYEREYGTMYEKVLAETDDPGEAHLQAHAWAKEFPDDEARDYAETCVMDLK